MSGDSPPSRQTPESGSVAGRRCRYCCETIHPEATKCRHCGEMLAAQRTPWRFSRFASLLGLATAVLSLFYALREGFYVVQDRQEQRADVESYRKAADRFERLGNLDYAQVALDRALAVMPSDPSLQLQAFLLNGGHRVRELEDWGLQAGQEVQDAVPGLIQDGFRLLAREYPRQDRTRILVTLGRLLSQDGKWDNKDEIESLWKEATALAPDDAEVVFWSGHFLLTREGRAAEALQRLQRAASLDPENAFYWEEIGEHGAELGELAAALRALRRAIELHPKQSELQRIRASNEAKRELGDLLIKADEEESIVSSDFFGIAMPEREELVALAHEGSTRRHVAYFAARFYFARGEFSKALAAARGSMGDYRSYMSSSDTPKLALLADILDASGFEPDTLAEAREILDRQGEAERFEEILEIGSREKQGHRYKLGLRVPREPSEDGLLAVRVFEGYPFAKAGVLEGDRILKFAHRQIRKLREIWIPLIEFAPGEDIPIQISRDGETIDLTLIVE